jgi:hypothetical protein
VGQPDIFDSCVKLDPDIPAVIPVPPRVPSDAAGVVHPANLAASAGFNPAFMPRLTFASGSSP